MGKTKTMFVEGVAEKISGKEAYEEKMKKKAAQAASVKTPSSQAASVEASSDKVKSTSEQKVKTDEISEKSDIIEAKKTKADMTRKPVTEPEAKTEGQTTATALPEAANIQPVEVITRKLKPKVRSKKYKDARTKVDHNKNYKISEAVKLLKEISYTKFDPSVELHLTVKTSPFNVIINLPHFAGKAKRVEIADDTTVEKLKKGKIDFDVLLATADMMPKLVVFARVLGPKGLMPNPKAGTLIKNKKDADKFSGNSMNVKTQKDSNAMHLVAGKLSQKESDLEENVKAIFDAVGEKQIVKAFLTSTMSPSIKLAF